MLDSFQDLIEGLTATPSSLRTALGDPVPDDIPDDVHAMLAELYTREQVEVRRVQSILRTPNARLRAIKYEPEMTRLEEAGDAPEAMLTQFNAERSELISLLVNLTLRDWHRQVDHEQQGEISLADEIEAHLEWDEAMLDRLQANT